jgi:hypothetical protein
MNRRILLLFLLLPLAPSSPAMAQTLSDAPSDLWRRPVLAGDPSFFTSAQSSSTPNRNSLCHFFRMPLSFAGDPIGVDSEPDPPLAPNGPFATACPADSTSGDRLQVVMGSHNPFFDFQRPGDPGGVGYYKLHSQMMLLDNSCSGLSMGLQALTPAGLEADGVAGGPTIVSPHLGWFYDAGDGTAIQGFVSKQVRARAGWTDDLGGDVRYGVGVQRPLPGFESNASQSLHMFVEALGRYRPNFDTAQGSPGKWDLLPGLHWRLNNSWWMSGGLLMPLTGSHLDSRYWQITCSWQF